MRKCPRHYECANVCKRYVCIYSNVFKASVCKYIVCMLALCECVFVYVCVCAQRVCTCVCFYLRGYALACIMSACVCVCVYACAFVHGAPAILPARQHRPSSAGEPPSAAQVPFREREMQSQVSDPDASGAKVTRVGTFAFKLNFP